MYQFLKKQPMYKDHEPEREVSMNTAKNDLAEQMRTEVDEKLSHRF